MKVKALARKLVIQCHNLQASADDMSSQVFRQSCHIMKNFRSRLLIINRNYIIEKFLKGLHPQALTIFSAIELILEKV